MFLQTVCLVCISIFVYDVLKAVLKAVVGKVVRYKIKIEHK